MIDGFIEKGKSWGIEEEQRRNEKLNEVFNPLSKRPFSKAEQTSEVPKSVVIFCHW